MDWWTEMNAPDMSMPAPQWPYMYLFVRQDLSMPQQIVQAAHAVDELTIRCPSEGENRMVLCGADNERMLKNIALYLDSEFIDYEMFHESDIGEYTAIATKPLRGSERRAMRRFNIMK